ncbi:type 1 fimbria pilin [Acinetobacter calcoaceticus]|uniref:Type 1 fimbria pilin n=1 Tax=Acinetobacter calcoaceticus TaxID=471 RepID=A0A4V2R1M2_ACICA|nr:type 1 fimbria pilin [Acinetobacter calcoaceticus]
MSVGGENVLWHRINKSAFLRLFFAVTVLQVSSMGFAEADRFGRINMKGEIHESACAIDLESYDQTVSLADLQHENSGQGITQPLNIKLTHCLLGNAQHDVPNWKKFQLTVDGRREGAMFTVGTPGVGFKIADRDGQFAVPGRVLPISFISTRNMYLKYSMVFVNQQGQVELGHIYSTLRFKMDYY